MKARRVIDKKTHERIRAEVKAEYDKQGQELARRYIKLWLVVENEVHGHGKKRSTKSLERFSELSAERKDDEVFWYHIDRKLEQMGFDFPKEDYEVMDI